MEQYLEENVFGQHLLLKIVTKAIKEHKEDKHPGKPLVLAFHGSTGTGKNFASGIIAQHLYGKGFDSNYVHRIISSHEFPLQDSGNLDLYKHKLKRMIEDGIVKCQYALFIIDEVDKMPPGLINVLKPYLDYNDKIDGNDFRKSIFIFLGNTGVDEINQVAIDYFKQGLLREDISMKSMNKLLKTLSYYSGGLVKSTLIDHHLVDFHVPFLPLEKAHIRSCAAVEFKKRNRRYDETHIEQVVNEIEFFPPGEDIYSVSGCKNVKRIVQVIL